jgi:peptide/nickel transport system permease protein
MDLIGSHWIYSFQLILLATIFAIILGVGLGMLAAVKQNTKIDYAASIFSFIGISIPGFWLGLMLILVFAVYLGVFKTYYDTSYPIWSLENLRQLIMPVLALGTGAAGYVLHAFGMLDNLRKSLLPPRAQGIIERTVIGNMCCATPCTLVPSSCSTWAALSSVGLT